MPVKQLNILVIDDDEDDLYLTCEWLRGIETYEITIDTEINYKKALQKIYENKHHVCLLDYRLGPHTGVEVIHECVQNGINKPFILLTGKGDRQIDIEAARAGAYDYLTKSDLNTELLERSLRYSMQRYAALVAVTESEHRYREIFMKSNDIIFVLDAGLTLVNFNPRMSGLLGYSNHELQGRPMASLFANAADAGLFIRHLTGSDLKNDLEINLLTRSGEQKTFLASCSNISSPDGVGVYQGILFDYTNIKKSVAEQLLREKIETTERLVRTLAHEIRNPLTNINLSLHQLESEIADDQKIFTDIVKRNSERINHLIGELMNLSNPVARVDKQIDCTRLVTGTLAMAKDRLQLKGIQLIEEYTPGITTIGDAGKLQTALLNIIINAVEAMEENKGRLNIQTLTSGSDLLIKISDNGCGISPENIALLFQPYFTGKKNGMGLGLATTHNYIHAHNGSIEVESMAGSGSTFTVKLPMV